jgi:hypothetical protein
MRRFSLLILSASIFACPAFAGEKMTGAAAEALLNDSTAWYLPLGPNSARQYFNRNGETPYIDAGGQKTFGQWMMRGDQYCSVWPPSDHYSCYDVEKGISPDGLPTITFVSGGNGPRYEAVLKSGEHLDEAWAG